MEDKDFQKPGCNLIRIRITVIFVFALTLALSACSPKYTTVTPELRTQLMRDFQAGTARLDCEIECSWSWIDSFQTLVGLYNSQQWEQLAEHVLQIGHGKDLSYFFLGRAAEGLGYNNAATKYYEQSLSLYKDPVRMHHCRDIGMCGGMDLASILPQRIVAVKTPNIKNSIGGGWSTLGTGLGGTCYALALAPDGTLYAGGKFSTAGGKSANNIAKWDGSSWSPVGTGMNGEVLALALASDGTLYAGGRFTTASGAKAKNIAKWNGLDWSPLGTGLDGDFSDPSEPKALRKERQSFHLDGEVCALALTSNGSLYAAGRFARAGGVRVNNIARWNGSAWSPLGTGLTGVDRQSPPPPLVATLTVAPDGTLYAGGYFEKAGGKGANHIAKWNGSTWSPLAAGVSGYKWVSVHRLAMASDGTLYVGGHFEHVGGRKDLIFNLAKWNGSTWSPVFGDGVHNDIAGLLVAPNGNLFLATGFGVIVWNGSNVLDLDADIPGAHSDFGMVLSSNGTLYVGGDFEKARGEAEGHGNIGTIKGGVPVNYIMQWNGSMRSKN